MLVHLEGVMVDTCEKVLRKIEFMEHNWYYQLTDVQDKAHSFGRISQDGKVVCLWSVPRTTGELLQFMVGLTKAKTILELGCSAGYSTLFLAKAARENKGHVYTTEIFEEKIKLARKNFKESGLEKDITLIEGDILQVLREWKKPLDFVFMDADKHNYSKYFDLLVPMLKRGGLIIADNANITITNSGEGIKHPAMCHFLGRIKHDKRVASYVLDFDNGLAIIYKK